MAMTINSLPPLVGAKAPRRQMLLAGAAFLCLLAPVSADADETDDSEDVVTFNPAFLPEGSNSVDLGRYGRGNPVLPGSYRSDIAVNGQLVGREDVRIISDDKSHSTYPCINSLILDLAAVDSEKLNPLSGGDPACRKMAELFEGANAIFDPNELRLDISVPQSALRRQPRGYVSPELWDEGINAGILSYDANLAHNRFRGRDTTSAYWGLAAGVNIGEWRVRHNGSGSWQSGGSVHYRSINSYAQRNIISLQSQLTLGETSTSGNIFDTLAFRGLLLASDDRMLPQTQRGYAPVIRGVARTNARVTVVQNGTILYETSVAPGAFTIDDLYPTGYGGDLEVLVREADGSEQRFKVPYASIAQLLRPGKMRYGLALGSSRDPFLDRQSPLAQGTIQYGVLNGLTSYGGIQLGRDYGALTAGAAVSTPVGALAADVTQAFTNLEAGKVTGQSFRLSYSNNIVSTGSHFSLAAYRFSTSGYYDFARAQHALEYERLGLAPDTLDRPRHRLSLALNQSLGELGQLALSGFTQDYWNRKGRDLYYQASWGRQFRYVNVGLTATRTRMGDGRMNNSFALTLGVPLTIGRKRAQMSGAVIRNPDGQWNQQMALGGSLGERDELSYGLTLGHQGAAGATSGAANMQYIGARTTLGSSVSVGKGYAGATVTASGSLLAHSDGVTLSPYRAETMALVSAKDAAGAKVDNYPGVKLDGKGHAIIPYLRPYEMNRVSIDPEGISLDVELQETSQRVAPTAGAVVRLDYASEKGKALLLRVTKTDGQFLPFGAAALNDQGEPLGTVGQGGQLYLRLPDPVGALTIRWGKNADQQCKVDLPAAEPGGAMQMHEAICRNAGG